MLGIFQATQSKKGHTCPDGKPVHLHAAAFGATTRVLRAPRLLACCVRACYCYARTGEHVRRVCLAASERERVGVQRAYPC
jgi:hypothetical protein